MAVFTYRAISDSAVVLEGAIAADTARAARDALRTSGLIVESVTASGGGAKSIRLPFRRQQRHSAKRVAFVRELSTLLAAGTGYPASPIAAANTNSVENTTRR